jgi:hypothetical protein
MASTVPLSWPVISMTNRRRPPPSFCTVRQVRRSVPTGFDRPDSGDGQRLWNLAPLIPDNQRFSRVFRGRGELIDHLLVSHALVKAVQTVTMGEIAIPSITEQPTERHNEPGSDHRPVVAVFDLVS